MMTIGTGMPLASPRQTPGRMSRQLYRGLPMIRSTPPEGKGLANGSPPGRKVFSVTLPVQRDLGMMLSPAGA